MAPKKEDEEAAPQITQVTVKNVPKVSMDTFNPERDQWEVYKERLENFLSCMRVTKENEKAPTLLSCIGAEAYKVVHFADLCIILKEYYEPHIVVFLERKTFYAAARKDTETIVEWLAPIKCMASNCELGDKLDFVTLKKFVTSLSGKSFDRISEETIGNLSLKKAVQLAVKYDKAKPTPVAETVDFVSQKSKSRSFKRKKSFDEKSNVKNSNKESRDRCRHCGYKNHSDDQCRYKSAKCRKCEQIGHLASVCKTKKENVKPGKKNWLLGAHIVACSSSIVSRLVSRQPQEFSRKKWKSYYKE